MLVIEGFSLPESCEKCFAFIENPCTNECAFKVSHFKLSTRPTKCPLREIKEVEKSNLNMEDDLKWLNKYVF